MDLDVTLFIQLGILALLVVVLKSSLFTPLLAVIESRHQKIHGTRAETERLERSGAADQQAYDTRIQEARRLSGRERERLRQIGRDEARQVLQQARIHMAQVMAQTREEVRAAEQAAKRVLDADVDVVARALVNQLLGKKAR